MDGGGRTKSGTRVERVGVRVVEKTERFRRIPFILSFSRRRGRRNIRIGFET
jgi:hypothetical protein